MYPERAMHIEGFFDPTSSTISYLVLDRRGGQCALVDSVLDYDPASGRTFTASADRLIARVHALGAQVQWILETHVHFDHLTAAHYLKHQLGGKIGIGSGVTIVQQVLGKMFYAGDGFACDGSQFDHLFADGEIFMIGGLQCRVLHTPGHTPACTTYVVSDGHEIAAFVGDTLFMPDNGTARCDFPSGDARMLYRSINIVLGLPLQTKLYMCHDYPPGTREVQFISTVADERATNVDVRDGISEEEFVAMRSARDTGLEMPALMLPSVQVNMRAGQLPQPDENGIRHLKIPHSVM